MEGQQPDPGDLSDVETAESGESVTAASDTAASDNTASDTAASDTAASDTAASDNDQPADASADEQTAVPASPSAARRWFTHNKTAVMVIGSAAFFVLAAAFAAAAAQPLLSERATVVTKLKIAQTAANAISTLWSYTPENMDKLSERASKYLGGDFEQQYRKYVDAIAETNKQAKVTSDTQVVGAAVESLTGTDATALVYTNTTSTSPQSNNIPSLQYLSYRLELKRYGRDWRVTKMTTVTSLDLTPKI